MNFEKFTKRRPTEFKKAPHKKNDNKRQYRVEAKSKRRIVW